MMVLSFDQACTSATPSSDLEASVVLYLMVTSCWLNALLVVPLTVLLTARLAVLLVLKLRVP